MDKKKTLFSLYEKTRKGEFKEESNEFKKYYGKAINYSSKPIYGRNELVSALDSLGTPSGSLALQFHAGWDAFGVPISEFPEVVSSAKNFNPANLDTVYVQSCSMGSNSKSCQKLSEAFGKPVIAQEKIHTGFRRDIPKSKRDSTSLSNILFSTLERNIIPSNQNNEQYNLELLNDTFKSLYDEYTQSKLKHSLLVDSRTGRYEIYRFTRAKKLEERINEIEDIFRNVPYNMNELFTDESGNLFHRDRIRRSQEIKYKQIKPKLKVFEQE